MNELLGNPTPAQKKSELLHHVLAAVPFTGWNNAAFGEDSAAQILFPNGITDVQDYWHEQQLEDLEQLYTTTLPQGLRTHERIAFAVQCYLKVLEPSRAAVRASSGWHFWRAPMMSKRVWAVADRCWWLVGETQTDYNFYTKRALLVTVLTSTLLFWLQDESTHREDTKAFLARRLQNVLSLGKWKKKIVALALICLFSHPAAAKDVGDLAKVRENLAQTQQSHRAILEKQDTLQKEIDRLREKAITYAARTQKLEQSLSQEEAHLEKLRSQQKVIENNLAAQRVAASATLKSLQRLARLPTHSLLMHPQQPIDAARGAALLQGLEGQFRVETEQLKQSQQQLAVVLAAAEKAWKKREAARLAHASKKEALAKVLAQKGALLKETEGDAAETKAALQQLSQRAATIQDLLSSLQALHRPTPPLESTREIIAAERRLAAAAERRAALRRALSLASNKNPVPKTAALQGLRLPVSGPVVVGYGQKNALGITSQGLTFRAPTGGIVVAPGAGKIVFADTFRSMGKMILIRQPSGQHLLLAGLGNIDTAVGRTVATGEPLGRMGAESTAAQLYLEVRRGTRVVNPLTSSGS